MAITATVLRASDSTVTQAETAPNLMSAVAMAVAARKGMSMGESFRVGGRAKKKRLDGVVEGAR